MVLEGEKRFNVMMSARKKASELAEWLVRSEEALAKGNLSDKDYSGLVVRIFSAHSEFTKSRSRTYPLSAELKRELYASRAPKDGVYPVIELSEVDEVDD